MQTYPLFKLADIPDGAARGFEVGDTDGFVVRQGDTVYAYRNVCPHAGNNLDWKPDAFLTRDKSRIMCAAHGALFDIQSGDCVAGPCVGFGLQTLDVRVEANDVVLYQ
ncbi:MAG TPA: Rieske (2Fe-2S) protein [Gammaproteobacteria bacterium]|nr:Rieske (2Fe-2S) protein [Gammaproteobacteria bacterium]